MTEVDWHKCRFLESSENLKPLVQRRFGRQPSTSIAREIAACLQQGRLFYQAATSSPLEIRPLQQFYGMVGFSKALVIARHCRSLSTLRPAHGLKDISVPNGRIAELRVRIKDAGTFQDFNDVVAELTRICYIDSSTSSRSISIPSTKADQLCTIELSLREILSRIPDLESLYRMTFHEDALTHLILLEDVAFHSLEPLIENTPSWDDENFHIRIDVSERFSDRDSVKQIVTHLREKFPFLTSWRLVSAQRAWDHSIIRFRNRRNSGIDEFSEERLRPQEGGFEGIDFVNEQTVTFPLVEGFYPVAGGYTGKCSAISPVNGCYFSEFSLHYLALFLLSSLVRYRPETWIHAISRSVMSEAPADDQALSLIERFLDLNGSVIPGMVVTVLNPDEDRFS
jgi:hypothetical protein